MTETSEYKVELDVFEGPLDLLLYLIKRDEVDIYNIPIETITSQYMEYLDMMKMLDLNIAGEFLVMAATLMMIKSRMLLPVEERAEDDEDDEDDPRWELVRQLVEYKKFKDAAGKLHHLEAYQEDVFSLGKENVVFEPDPAGAVVEDVSLFDLLAAFNQVLKRAKPEEFGEIASDRFTVGDQIDHLLRRLERKAQIRFSELFGEEVHRFEVICAFLAMLELLRLNQIHVSQEGAFGDIVIKGVSEG